MSPFTLGLAGASLHGLCSFPPSWLTDGGGAPRGLDKPVLLLLHGWQDNAASFTPLFPLLVDDYYLVALDWPGHGLSSHRSSDNYYHFVDYIDDLALVVDALPSNRVVLLGHSLGALVSVCYAAAFPERVDGAVLLEGLAPLSESPQNAVLRLRQGIESRQRFRLRQARLPRTMPDLELAVRLRCQINGLSPEQVRPLVERGTYNDGGRWFWRHDPRLRCDSLYRMGEEQAAAYVLSLSCPVLSIVGQSGFASLKGQSGRLPDWPTLIQHEVPGGHHCHLESPERVAEQIILFRSNMKNSVFEPNVS
ncbi:hypothetical protein ABT56_02865 [Photobacterium aquae]|uniref:AB hydrolase-1 domain-containing protein n=1 Tax=Photobacterium aquae TaxID=1195763 RepID=A0A0J1HBY6_9GAMM|nr:alpha/beta hydrolase [Photobacterium aquae]KLV09151.1 hypothetical protein ABT56_02865 [Photobacterium aquae]